MDKDREGQQAAAVAEPVPPLPAVVLVPILLIGGGLGLAEILISPRLGSFWPTLIMVSTTVTVWGIAVWVIRNGVTREATFLMVLWADTAVTAIAISMHHDAVNLVSLAMFALPSGVVALYGSRPMMTLQVVAVVIGALAILRQLALSPIDLAVQCIATLLATISPALAVLMLRDRLVRALERERDLGLNDLLTGVRNRRGLEAAMPRMLGAARASGLPVGVVLLDLDHFKQVNDTYGHTGGDLVLRHVAARLLAVVRDGDTVSRLGGEEFVVLCVIDPEDLQALGERLRRDISQNPPHHVTVSLGATWFHPGLESSADDHEQIWALIDRADQLMYRAKREGRDRLCIAVGDSKGTVHAQPRTSGRAGWTPSRQEASVPPVERLTPEQTPIR